MQDNDIHHRDHDPHPIVSHESTNGLKQNDEHVHITEQQTGVYLTLYLASRGTKKKGSKKNHHKPDHLYSTSDLSVLLFKFHPFLN